MKYQITSTGNTIIADQSFMDEHYPNDYVVIPEDPIALVTDPTEWFIDLGPFFDRFGDTKMSVLTSPDPVLKAILTDIQIRKWIDLKRADVAQALTYIGTKVPSVTLELQTTILTTPVTELENSALRKLYF